jgi:Mlc titration factor MtfA (ptsG expression regulator)
MQERVAVAFFVLCLAATLLIAALLGYPRWKAYQRRRVWEQPFPARWRRVLQRRVPMVQRLPVGLQLQLKKHMQVFIAEKAFIGCGGLTVTEDMRVVVAAQACLLLLNRPADYFRNVSQILMYPHAFMVNRSSVDRAGVQQDNRQALAGESWTQGQVILSWQDVLEGASIADDGRNVVIHEFAHQLDQESGRATGAPLPSLGNHAYNAQRWQQVMAQSFAHLQYEANNGIQGLLNHYGAQDPAEFFAVITEAFFEQGASLSEAYPAAYAELRTYYQVDPAAW